MSVFFNRFSDLCRINGESPNAIAKLLGIPSGSITAWKNGTIPRTKTLDKLADYFNTTVDYLLGRTDDPINYDDGDLIAGIPLSYLEACDGDVKKAYAMMQAVDQDAGREDTLEIKNFYQIDNPDIRMIARAGKKMTSDQAENIRKYAQYMYPEAFEDDK